MEHLIKKVEQVKDIDAIFVITNNKFYDVFNDWLSGFKSGKKIEIINDNTTSNEDRLGSLGDVNFVIRQEKIKDDILIVAGDNLFEFSINEFIEWIKHTDKSAVVLYDVNDRELAKQYGIVETDRDNKMIDFEEKPIKPKSTLASTGVYFYPAHVLPMLQNYVNKYKNSDKAGNFLEWLHKNEDVYCYITQKRWIDIGSLDQLEKARKEFRA